MSFPIATNYDNDNQTNSVVSTQETRSVKTTATNAFLTAASLFKYWVQNLFYNLIPTIKNIMLYK